MWLWKTLKKNKKKPDVRDLENANTIIRKESEKKNKKIGTT